MTSRRIAPLFCLALVACGTGGAPAGRDDAGADAPREETVLDDLVEQKERIPAQIEAAGQQRVDDTRRALESAEGGAERGAESSR